MLIRQRGTFADAFLLRVLCPYLDATRARRLLALADLWNQPWSDEAEQPAARTWPVAAWLRAAWQRCADGGLHLRRRSSGIRPA